MSNLTTKKHIQEFREKFVKKDISYPVNSSRSEVINIEKMLSFLEAVISQVREETLKESNDEYLAERMKELKLKMYAMPAFRTIQVEDQSLEVNTKYQIASLINVFIPDKYKEKLSDPSVEDSSKQ